MIIDLISIFRARREPKVAAKLAARFAHGQAIERVTAPLLIIHIAIWLGVILMIVLTIMILTLANATHGSVGLLCIIPVTIAVGGAALSIGLKRGLDRIKDIAGRIGDQGIDRAVAWREKVTAPSLADQLDIKPLNGDRTGTNGESHH